MRGCTRAFERRDQRVEGFEPDAGVALGQHVRTQGHRRADDLRREWIADAGGMAADQIDLKRAQLIARDAHLRERAESRC